MLSIDSLENGIVIDHITAGKGMKIYDLLELNKLNSCVAIIKNAKSNKYGKKDIIKIDTITDIDLNVLGFVDHRATVCIIKDGKLVDKKILSLPKQLINIVKCKNPRCITSIEEFQDQIFYLSEGDNVKYRCKFCEQEVGIKNEK